MAEQVKLCERCAVRCRTVARPNPDASVFVRGDAKTGRLCTNCVVVDFLRNFDMGPQLPVEFDPEPFRAPHIQEQFAAVINAAKANYGAELSPEEVDWDEVAANWALPFPSKRKKR